MGGDSLVVDFVLRITSTPGLAHPESSDPECIGIASL